MIAFRLMIAFRQIYEDAPEFIEMPKSLQHQRVEVVLLPLNELSEISRQEKKRTLLERDGVCNPVLNVLRCRQPNETLQRVARKEQSELRATRQQHAVYLRTDPAQGFGIGNFAVRKNLPESANIDNSFQS
jgi:hypothetical protein